MQPIYDNQEAFESALDKAWKSYNESGARTVDSCEDNYTECAYAKGFREGYLFGLEGQKEQKPLSIEETELNSIAFLEQKGYTCIPPGKEQKLAEWMAKQVVKAHCVESANPASENPETRLHLITLLYKENEDIPYVQGGDDIDIIIRKK